MTKPIEISGVSAHYGKRTIISDVTLTVEPGEIFGIIGLNGVGKSTLIRAMLGLVSCDGDISFFGEPHTDYRSRRNLVYLPEKFQPSPLLKGWEHLSLHAAFVKQSLDREQAKDLATGLALDPEALPKRVKTYSKGMGQKLGLISALMTDVPLMILDEPMSGLDPLARVLLKEQLHAWRRDNRSIVFSSHILADVEEMCDRIAIIHDGGVKFLGTPEELLSSSAAPNLERAFLSAIGISPDKVETVPVDRVS